MKSLLSGCLRLLPFAVFVVALADVASGFDRLTLGGTVVLAGGCLVLLILLARSTSLRRRPVPFVLLGGCLLALGTRLGGFEAVAHRSPAEWMGFQSQRGELIARHVSERFSDLCHRAQLAARTLAAESSLRAAVAQPDKAEALSLAFELLERTLVPSPLPESFPGVVLYDEWSAPIAWSGNTVDLRSRFTTLPQSPGGQTIVFEQGVFTHLIVFQPVDAGKGTLAVEIPLSARRGIDNRYLRDFEVAAAWSGNGVSTDYVDSREPAPELATLFERNEDRYWGGTEDAPVLYFPLRAPAGELLAVVQLNVEDSAAALLETKRTAQELAGLFLSLAALFAVVWFGMELRQSQNLTGALLFLASLCGFRIVASLADAPLGLFLGLDNPANYASGALFDLLRSPADLLLTALMFAVSAATLTWFILSRETRKTRLDTSRTGTAGWLGAFLFQVVARVAALAVILLAVWFVRDSWSNSNLALATPGLVPLDAPRLAVQVALVAIWVATALVTVSLVAVTESVSGAGSRSAFRLARYWALDVLVLAFAYSLSGGGSLAAFLLLSLPVLIAFDTLAFARDSLSVNLRQGAVYARFAALFLLLVVPVLSYFPAVAYFERWVTRAFVEETVAPAVIHQDDSQLYVLQATLRAIDRMELAGHFAQPDRDQLAYQIWSGSDLSDFALSSAVDIYAEDDTLVSRFALNFPDSELEWHEPEGPPPEQWVIYEETYPGEPNRPRVFHARRALPIEGGAPWDLQIRLVAGWGNLPFIATRSPYADLFRSAAADAPLPAAHPDLALYVFDRQGDRIFSSGEQTLDLGSGVFGAASPSPASPHWVDEEGGSGFDVLIFSDETYVYGLALPGKSAIAYGADLAGWVILAALMGLALLVLTSTIAWLGGGVTFRAWDVWTDVGTSFYGKLFVAFVLLALIPIASLALVVRGIMVQQLQHDVEQEGVGRAQVVGRFVRDYLLLDRIDASERGVAAVSDPLLEWVSSLVSADVDLFSRGELVATSERELFDSGLLPARVPPTAYREVVLNSANHSIHRESVGAFRYFVVSVPIALERWREPGVLSLPLASRQREIDEQIQTLNQTVLLAALCFFLIAAALAYSLARRIAEPINTLTATTRSVAQGNFDVSLQTSSRDEIGALFESFNQMTADLKRQREHLERTKKLEAWAEMARQVAHEVKNPLTPIQLSTEHLLRVYDDPDVDFREVLKGCSETIFQQVKTLREISREFSSFASPFPLEPEPTDLGGLIRATLAPYLHAPPPGVTIELEIADELPRISLDRRLIQRTLINLVENSLNAINGSGRVSVRARLDPSENGNGVELEISDTGMGIDPAVRHRIFEPYFSTRPSGTGLGLAIVRKAVDEHGGSISVESERGKGTSVRVRLPLKPPSDSLESSTPVY
jgi:signal transduction histidine kinase